MVFSCCLSVFLFLFLIFFFKQKTAYEMRISDWSSDVCSSDLLAPGKQEEFIRRIDQADAVAAAGGFPPIQLFFHENGADFDVILFKPVTGIEPTPEQAAAMDRKRKELGLPSGPAYFVNIRELVAEPSESKTYGPLSAATWLGRIDKWRAENPPHQPTGAAR